MTTNKRMAEHIRITRNEAHRTGEFTVSMLCDCGGDVRLVTNQFIGHAEGLRCNRCEQTYTVRWDFTKVWIE